MPHPIPKPADVQRRLAVLARRREIERDNARQAVIILAELLEEWHEDAPRGENITRRRLPERTRAALAERIVTGARS